MTSNETPYLNPKDIFAAVSELGIGGTAPSLDAHFDGGQCRVYKVSFENQESVAVRVPHVRTDSSPDFSIYQLSMELQMLRMLETKGFPWAPRCRGHNLSFDNPVKLPFLVLTWAEGSNPRWDDEFPPRPLRDKFLGQVAAIQVSLLECTLRTSPTTAAEFFERIVGNRRRRVREGHIPELCEQDCADQQALLPRVLGRHGCDVMVAVDHGDVKPANIVVDDDFNVVCLIDWGFAATVPRLRAAGLPRFLWGPLTSSAAQEDLRSYVASFESMGSPEAAFVRRIQAAPDVHLRTMYVESLFSKGAHAALVAEGWKLPGCELVEEEREDGGVCYGTV